MVEQNTIARVHTIRFSVINCHPVCIQFCNGISFIYPDLPIDLIKSALEAENISVFYHNQIKGKYEGDAIESHCIRDEEESKGGWPDGIYNPEQREDEDDFDMYAHI